MIVDATPENITARLKEVGIDDADMLCPDLREVVRLLVKHRNVLVARRWPDGSINFTCYELEITFKPKK